MFACCTAVRTETLHGKSDIQDDAKMSERLWGSLLLMEDSLLTSVISGLYCKSVQLSLTLSMWCELV